MNIRPKLNRFSKYGNGLPTILRILIYENYLNESNV